MKKISSIHNSLVTYLVSLKNKKQRYETKEYVVEGWHLVEKAMTKSVVKSIFIVETEFYKYQKELSDQYDVYLISYEILKKVTQNITPQPIFALCIMKENLQAANNNILVLDDIQDPSNLGAILRSCAAFEIKEVLLSQNSVDFYNSKVISASQGAIFDVKVSYCDLLMTLSKLKNKGYYIYSTFLHEPVPPVSLEKIQFKNKNIFIFGNEGKGISSNLKSVVDQNFNITTSTNVESLNLSISVAITLYIFHQFKL